MYDVILTYKDNRQSLTTFDRLKTANNHSAENFAKSECMRATIINQKTYNVVADRCK